MAEEIKAETVKEKTGIEWERIVAREDNGTKVVRELSRPYPSQEAPRGVQGQGVPPQVVDANVAQTAAVSFMAENVSLFLGENGPAILKEPDIAVKEVIANTYPEEYAERGTDFTVVMGQLYKGVPVFESQARACFTQFGELWRLRSDFAVLEGVPDDPALTPDQALGIARGRLNSDDAESEEPPKLFVYPPSKLVWRMNFLDPHFKEMLVDAVTGEVVLMRKNVRDDPPAEGSAAQADRPPVCSGGGTVPANDIPVVNKGGESAGEPQAPICTGSGQLLGGEADPAGKQAEAIGEAQAPVCTGMGPQPAIEVVIMGAEASAPGEMLLPVCLEGGAPAADETGPASAESQIPAGEQVPVCVEEGPLSAGEVGAEGDVHTEALTATIWDAWWSNAKDDDQDGYVQSVRLNWDADVAGGSGSLTVFEKIYFKTYTSGTWSLLTTTSNHVITDTKTTDKKYVSINSGSHTKWDWKIKIYRSGQGSPDDDYDPSDDSNLNDYKMETAAQDAIPAEIWDAWWSNEKDDDSDGYVQYARLNWDPDVAVGTGSLTVFEKVYFKTSTSSTWTLLTTTSNHVINGTSTSDKKYVSINSGSHAKWDWKIEIYRSGESSADDSYGPSDDSNLNDYKMETAAQDGKTAEIWDAWWSNATDTDGDGYVRSARLNWDPDVDVGTGSLTVFEKIYYKRSTSSTWSLLTTTSNHVITGTQTSDKQYVTVNGGNHAKWDWKIKIYRNGQSSPDDDYDPSDDSDLNDYKMETSAEDTILLTAKVWDAWWSNATDTDSDGYVRSARLNWDPDVTGGGGSITVFEKIYYKTSTSSTWSLLTTTSNHVITGTASTDKQYVSISGGNHAKWDWKIKIYRSGQSSPDDDYDPSDDSDLNDYKMETSAQDTIVLTATIWNAWWSNTVDNDSDGYVQFARLNWDPDVSGGSGSITVYEKIYFKTSTSSTWTLLATTSNHVITDTLSSDSQYVGISGGNHALWDWRIKIYRSGQSLPDDDYGPTDDTDLNDYKMETVDEDGRECTIKLTIRDTDGNGLRHATGLYYAGSVERWSKEANASGFMQDTDSPVDSQCFCRARTICTHLDVRDENSGNNTVEWDTSNFATANNGTYTKTIDLTNSTGVNASEGSVAFRECMRAWDYVNTNYSYQRALTTVRVDSASGPSCGGNIMYMPHDRAVLDNGAPSAASSIDDTLLHEYGHVIQYGAYGGTFGRPRGCTCDNHGGTANDCSFDALIEGWANYFPVMLYNHINSSDISYHWSNSTNSRSIESNSNTDTEERDEWSFAGVLFDIYDSNNDGDDRLSLGDDEIWTVFRNDMPGTVEEFFQCFITRYPAHAAALEDIYTDHGMDPDWLTLGRTNIGFGKTDTRETFTIRRQRWYGDGVIVQPTWQITDNRAWITVNPVAGDTTTETDTITVTIDRSLLSAGNNTGHITVTPQYYGRPQVITVTAKAVRATIWDAWWTDEVDDDGDGYVQSTKLRWDPDVNGDSGSLEVYEKIYYKQASASTWTLIKTMSDHTITGTSTSDKKRVSIKSGSHNLWDWKIEIYRSGETTADYTRSPSNDGSLNNYKMELEDEDDSSSSRGSSGNVSGNVNGAPVNGSVSAATDDTTGYTSGDIVDLTSGNVLLQLIEVDSLMSWHSRAAATTTCGAGNLMELTGGDFELYTAIIFDTGESLTVNAQVTAVTQDQLSANVVLNGSVPPVGTSDIVELGDYTEHWAQTSATTISMMATGRTFTVNGIPHTYEVTSILTYNGDVALDRDLIFTTGELNTKYDHYEHTLHFDHYSWLAPAPMLSVESKPVYGVPITGDRTGTTGFGVSGDIGEIVTLTAPATTTIGGVQYDFVAWMGDGTPDGQNIEVELDCTLMVTAEYIPHPQNLNVQSTPIATVSIIGGRPGITDYTAICDDQEVVDLVAPLIATTPEGVRYDFVRWTVDTIEQPAGDTTAQVTMDAEHTAIAAYQIQTHALVVQSSPTAGVSITGDKAGITDYTTSCDDQEVVDLTAPSSATVDDVDYRFVRWIVDDVEEAQGQTGVQITMDNKHTAEASYDLLGDVTGDCVVNVLDFIGVRNHMYEDPATGDNWRYDLTGDGSINILDMISVRNHVRARCPEEPLE